MSEKISEKFPTTELLPDREDDDYSPSSNSTVSSSGDVEGVYTLHSSDKDDSDLSTSDDEGMGLYCHLLITRGYPWSVFIDVIMF